MVAKTLVNTKGSSDASTIFISFFNLFILVLVPFLLNSGGAVKLLIYVY
jgi:hypothetical protein